MMTPPIQQTQQDKAAAPPPAGQTGERFCDQLSGVLTGAQIRQLNEISAWRSLLYFLDSWFWLGAALAAGVMLFGTWWLLLILPFVATRLHANAILLHDAAHYRLFKTRWLNDLCGMMLGWPMLASMHSYRIVHRLHHNHLYDDRLDPDMALQAGYPRGVLYLWRKLLKDLSGITAYKNLSYFFGRLAGLDGVSNPEDDTSPRLRQRAVWDRRGIVLFHILLITASVIWGFWPYLLVLWYLPYLTVYQVILRIRAILEHGAVPDVTDVKQAARTNMMPFWVSWLFFPYHVHYHIEHHLYPAIPHYNLPRAHALLRQAGGLENAEVVSVWQALGKIFQDRKGPPQRPLQGA